MGKYHKNNEFSKDQVFTATAVSTNVIDTGAAKIGEGGAIDLEVVVSVDFAGGTSLAVQICDCATEGGSYVMRQQSAVIALANLVTGLEPIVKMALPNGLARFLQLNYVVVGTMSGGGAVTSYLVDRSR